MEFFERINVSGTPKKLIIDAGLEAITCVDKNKAVDILYELIKIDEKSIRKNVLIEKKLAEYLGRSGRHSEAAAIIRKNKQNKIS